MSLSTLGKIGMADKLSVAQLQQAVKSGSIPSYIGVPLIAEKMKEEQKAESERMAQQPEPPKVAEQIMAAAAQKEMSGLGDLQTNLPEQYASGGIIGYDEGGDITQEEYDDQIADAEFDQFARAMINRTPNVEKGLRAAPSMSYGQVQGQNLRAAHAAEAPKSDHKYADTVLKYAEQYGVDPKLALHVLNKETGGMKNPETAKSKAGAQGIMQTIPSTSKMLGIKDPYDPEQSAEGGVRYLAQLGKQFGNDPRLTAAAYNAGPGNVRKYGGVPPFAETQNYVKGLAEGGIASIKRYNGAIDGSLIQETDDPDYVLYKGVRTKRSLLDQSEKSPWNSDRGMTYPSATEGLGTDLKTGAIKTLAATGDVLRSPLYAIDRAFGSPFMDKSATPFYDKYVRQAGLDPEPEPVTPTSTQTIGPGNAGTARRDQIAAENKIAAETPSAYKPQTGSYDKTTGTFTAPKQDVEPPKTPEKPAEKSSWQSLRDLIDERKAERKAQKDQDMWLALMAGGLGAMAGTSQYAGVNIGQGAMHGLQQYGTARREANKEEAADVKNLANIARYEEMGKYYNDQLENKLATTKGAQDQKEYIAANNVMKNLWEARMDEAKYMYGDPKTWDDPTRAKAMAFVNQVKSDPKYIDAERRIGQLQGFSVVGQRPAA